MDEKPEWMIAHEQSDLQQFDSLHKNLKEIKEMLKPVVDTYETVARLGKWSKLLLGFILLVLSVGVAIKKLLY